MLLIVSLIVLVVFYIQKNNLLFENIKKDLTFSKSNLESEMKAYKNQLDKLKKEVVEDKRNTINTTMDINNAINTDYQRIVNPLFPPERSFPFRLNNLGVPINIPTRGPSSGYQQVGVLVEENAENGNKKILPLFGEQTYPGSNQWKYYTNTDGFQAVKLPVNHKNKNCQDTYGCDEIYDGYEVRVDPYNTSYKAIIYKLDAPRYIPNVF